MNEYPCPLYKTGMCRYGGNKKYNYGFVRGTASYCYFSKKFIHNMDGCPLLKDKNDEKN